MNDFHDFVILARHCYIAEDKVPILAGLPWVRGIISLSLIAVELMIVPVISDFCADGERYQCQGGAW